MAEEARKLSASGETQSMVEVDEGRYDYWMLVILPGMGDLRI